MRVKPSHVRLGPLAAILVLCAAAASAATFGTVVPIGGHASDIALDEARGVLYIANFTANRIEVMSTQDNTIRTSLNVAPQPGSLALSPDGQYLVVAHYGAWQTPGTNKSALTVINLNDGGRQTFALGNAPLGVAFGADGMAFVVTTVEVLLFDPVSGATTPMFTYTELADKALPAKPGSFPANIIAASVAASGNGMWIYGLAEATEGVLWYRYDVRVRQIAAMRFVSSPPMGPRVMSPSRDGGYFFTGWGLFDHNCQLISEFTNVTGALEKGSHAIDMDGGVIYAQMSNFNAPDTPVLMALEPGSLAVRERYNLAENLSGRSLLNSARDVMYSVSDSGVTVFPVGYLNRVKRVAAGQEDLVFRGNFCDRRVITQDLTIADPGGGNTDFTLSPSLPGITVTPSSGMTPAVVKVRIDPNLFQSQNGTTAAQIAITSRGAVNIPGAVRVLINNRNPDQRGTFINVPGKLTDLLADPVRDRFYVLRQDKNRVLVYEGSTYTQIGSLLTFNTPTQMAITFDRKYLLIGHDDSQFAMVYDLDTLEQQPPIVFPFGHYPRSIAASGKSVIAVSRLASGKGTVDVVDFATRRAVNLPALGIYKNELHLDTVLTASPNGANVLAASPDGNVMLYSANSDTFIVSRKDFKELRGAYAASSYEQYVVDNYVLNSSLVTMRKLETGTGASSGFVFVDQGGFRVTSPGASAPGVIQRVDGYGDGVRATRMVESPLLPPPPKTAPAGSAADSVPTATSESAFTRTLAALYNRASVVALTTSGFTILPWNYDAAVAPPRIEKVVNAADMTLPVAPGGLISIFGNQFSPVNVATREVPLPTALGESCLTVNGVALPMLFVSPSQINAQLPFNMDGRAVLVLRTPGGVSDNFNFTVLPTAPSVFRSGTAGPETNIPTVVRAKNGEFVTPSNPIHPGDQIIIYATGLGATEPAAEAGVPAPSDPLPRTVIEAQVTLGGVPLGIAYAGLAPGQVGVYQINAFVPDYVPEGMSIPLTISQGGSSTTLEVRVVK